MRNLDRSTVTLSTEAVVTRPAEPGAAARRGAFGRRSVKLLAAAWLASFIVIGSAHAEPRFSDHNRHRFCRYATQIAGPGYTVTEVKHLIDCATDHFPVPGGDAKAFYIANRESGFHCNADNPSSSAAGVYQIVSSTWSSWWWIHGVYLNRHGWKLKHANPYHCRPNVMVAIRAAHVGGWGPWGG